MRTFFQNCVVIIHLTVATSTTVVQCIIRLFCARLITSVSERARLIRYFQQNFFDYFFSHAFFMKYISKVGYNRKTKEMFTML